ncbi:MAG: VOC family protein [Myxococcota bacterium]
MSAPQAPSSPVKLDHVAFGVPDVTAVVPFVVGQLGGRELDVGPGGGFRWWQWQFEGGGALEILEPDGPPDGFLHRFLKARGGPAPHHVTFKVPDLRAAMERARALGHDVVGVDASSPSWMEAFLHPKKAQGIVVQIVESHPGTGDWKEDGAYRFPDAPADVPAPVTLLGVRLNAHAEERARAQWSELLRGSCEREDGTLVFRWPDSPLRLAVQVDPARPEGPLALEVAADRDLRLPEGPHPTLGLPVVQVEERT